MSEEPKEKLRKTAIGGGVYADQFGGFWARPWVSKVGKKRRTWKKLKATREREAIKEANKTDFEAKAIKLPDLAELYLTAGCPNSKLESRVANQRLCKTEKANVKMLNGFFDGYRANEIRLPVIPKYAEWRMRQVKRGTGARTVDLEITTLSNILTYGVSIEELEFNYIRQNRPRFQSEANVKHCVENAPTDGDVLNKIADYLFNNIRSETTAWMTLFAAVFGTRRSELLCLKMNAEVVNNKPGPGLVKDDILYIRRSKKGINPKIRLNDVSREIIECFKNWHQERFQGCDWYFPGEDGESCITKDALGRALARACKDLKIAHVTPHGLRSYYVTKRRREGASDAVIAEEIGDKEVSMVSSIYGDFIEGEPLSYYPKEGLPAWHRWKPSSAKVVAVPFS